MNREKETKILPNIKESNSEISIDEKKCKELAKKIKFLDLPTTCKTFLRKNTKLPNRYNTKSKQIWGSVFNPGLGDSNRRYGYGHDNSSTGDENNKSDTRSTHQLKMDSMLEFKLMYQAGNSATHTIHMPKRFNSNKYSSK